MSMSPYLEVRLKNLNGKHYVTIKDRTAAYVISLHDKDQLEGLIDDLTHVKWLWDQKTAQPTLPRPAMFEDDEADVNDSRGQ